MTTNPLHRVDVNLLLSAMKTVGMDPYKAIDYSIAVAAAKEWSEGRSSHEELIRSLRNLVILCPGLRSADYKPPTKL
jgi:hypothetical protein